MFGLGFGEIVIILVLALILLGPQRLPDAAKQLGKGLREFKKATDDLKSQFEGELYSDARPQPPRRVEPPPVPAAVPPALAPGGGLPAAGAEAPPATAENVPGLEAALAEPSPSAGPAQARHEPAPARLPEEKAP
jgi:sec-independent protein translocase protein TatB